MKIRCPRCEKLLSIPDKYAGKAIRCPGCNQAFKVPALAAAVGGTGGGSNVDLEDLARLEQGTSQMSEEDLAAHEAQQTPEASDEPGYRTCPNCKKKTKETNSNVDLLCSHCWKPIAATGGGGGLGGKKAREGIKEIKATGKGGFYTELGSAFAYPLGAMSSILTASGIAFFAAILPVVILTLGLNLMEQSNVGTEGGVQEANLSGVQVILMGIFALEVFLFSAISIHTFFDVVRTTGVNDDAAPKLTFGPSQWGKSFVSYLILVVYFAAMAWIVSYLTLPPECIDLLTSGKTDALLSQLTTVFVVGMAIVTFFIPMNLIGIALGTVGQALNPSNVVKSVLRTHVHYVFLVLILMVYGGLFSYLFIQIVFGWFLPQLSEMKEGSAGGQLTAVALPLLAWGAVMAFFFYGAYVLGRLHGLFVRSFRKHLLFGTN